MRASLALNGLIFKEIFITDTYSSDWKKGNIVPVHKKGDKDFI